MTKIIAREVPPEHVDFRGYFDTDAFSSVCGAEYAVYILETRHSMGLNDDEYREIVREMEDILQDHDDGDGVPMSLQEWVKTANPGSVDCVAEYLSIKTGKRWAVASFTGYCQGDFCNIIYCADVYDRDAVEEIGKMWLGCGTEFVIDGVGGYYVVDTLRWEEGEKLRATLAGWYGCKPEELEVQLWKGERRVPIYETLEGEVV